MMAWPNCAKGRAVVTATTLNVRSGNGTSFSIIGKLAYGAVVDVWAVLAGWYLVQASNGMTGWCSSQYLRLSEELQP